MVAIRIAPTTVRPIEPRPPVTAFPPTCLSSSRAWAADRAAAARDGVPADEGGGDRVVGQRSLEEQRRVLARRALQHAGDAGADPRDDEGADGDPGDAEGGGAPGRAVLPRQVQLAAE